MCLSYTPVMCNDHFPNTWLMSPVPDCGLGCAGGCGGEGRVCGGGESGICMMGTLTAACRKGLVIFR